MGKDSEIVYSEPNVWHYGGCATESDYPCDCGATPTMSDPTLPEVL